MHALVSAVLLAAWLAELSVCTTDAQQVYYVQPTVTPLPACPSPCHPLSFYLGNVTQYFESNTTLVFLPGEHIIQSDTFAEISNVADLNLEGQVKENTLPALGAQVVQAIIVCANHWLEFHFVNVTNLRVTKLIFSYCGQKIIPTHLSNHILPATIWITESENVELQEVGIFNGTGYGLLAVNVLGNSRVVNSTFFGNNFYTLQEEECEQGSCVGGNALFVYKNGQENITEFPTCRNNNSLYIFNSLFRQGFSGVLEVNSFLHQGFGGGLEVIFESTTYGMEIVIDRVVSVGNTGLLGANMFISMADFVDNCWIRIQNSVIGLGNPLFSNTIRAARGSGLFYAYGTSAMGTEYNATKVLTSGLEISGTSFILNYGSQSVLDFILSPKHNYDFVHHIRIEGCNFTKGTELLSISEQSANPAECESPFKIWVDNSSFEHGEGVSLSSVKSISFSNCLFANNSNTALETTASNIHILGNLTFNHNKGQYGGGLSLNLGSFMFLHPHTHVRFHGNGALKGGAIYVQDSSGSSLIGEQLCFYRLESALGDGWFDTQVSFIENTAAEGGSDLYGGNIDTCHVEVQDMMKHQYLPSRSVSAVVFDFPAENNHSAISSDPTGVCLCINESTFCDLTVNMTTYPGHQFSIPAVLIGQRNGMVSGMVGAKLLSNATVAALDELQSIQRVGSACTALNYSVFSAQKTETLILFPLGPHRITHPLIIPLHLTPCPKGFKLSSTHSACIPIKGPIIPSQSNNPVGLCLCMQSENCKPTGNFSVIQTHAHPGETIGILVMIVGNNGTVPGAVMATFDTNGTSMPFGTIQQQLSNGCVNVKYKLNEMVTAMTLQAENSTQMSSYIHVSINTLPCPVGFQLRGNPPVCGCASILSNHGIGVCNVSDQTISRPGSMWVGTENGSVVLSPNCSPDYCKQGDMDLQLSSPDVQCSFNRSGVLCGACQPDLSITLGSSECHKCSSLYAALVVAMALMGLVLVVAITLFPPFTVSVGAFNGLLFYVNIIQLDSTIFFPLQIPAGGLRRFLNVFISWPNLDFGIETCFYNGMDAIGKTWLQYVFPTYLIITAIIVAIFCHRIACIKQHLGKKSISMLATVTLLCYMKLLRTTVTVISFTTVLKEDGTQSHVWLYDGNVPFLQGKHIVLAFFAIAVGFVLFIYTFVLLLTPLLVRCCNRKGILECYVAPFKSNHVAPFWFSFTIAARIVIFFVFWLTSINGAIKINLCVTLTIIALLFTMFSLAGRVYRSFVVNLSEVAFLLNLGVLTTWSLLQDDYQFVATYIMVVIALLTAVVLVGFYIILQVWQLVNRSKNISMDLVRGPKWSNSEGSEIAHDLLMAGEGEETLADTTEIEPPFTVAVDPSDHEPTTSEMQDVAANVEEHDTD